MGNISQSSKRSALKGFDVYFQHEKQMNKHKYKIKDLVEYKSSNPNLENRQAYIKEIKKQADGSYKMMLIVHFDGDNKLKDREYFFNNPEDWAAWWIHENDIVKLINRK